MAAIHIGISGWRHVPWREMFCYFDMHLDKNLATVPGKPAAEGVLP